MMHAYVKLLRLHQWTKNGFCLAGVLFSGDFLTKPEVIVDAFGVFASFCAVSSAVYIFNDLVDRERDRKHPVKCHRPIASGTIGVPVATLLMVLLAVAGLVGGYRLGVAVFGCLLLYVVNNVAYSWALKHMALFDVLCVALGFVVRLLAGVYGIGELPTTWIVLCTFFLTVFLGFAKRRAELGGLLEYEEPQRKLTSLIEEGTERRPVLSKYTLQFLDYLLNTSAVMVVMSYALFTTTSGKNPSLVITVPLVFFAIMHYKRLVVLWNLGEEPDWILLKDLRIQISIGLWLAGYLVIMYGGLPPLFRADVPH